MFCEMSFFPGRSRVRDSSCHVMASSRSSFNHMWWTRAHLSVPKTLWNPRVLFATEIRYFLVFFFLFFFPSKSFAKEPKFTSGEMEWAWARRGFRWALKLSRTGWEQLGMCKINLNGRGCYYRSSGASWMRFAGFSSEWHQNWGCMGNGCTTTPPKWHGPYLVRVT